MDQFTSKQGDSVIGLLSGWDRIVFRGTYRILCVARGMMEYLWQTSVLLKQFGDHAEAMTRMLMNATVETAERLERPVRYLASSGTDKEAIAREILQQSPVESGLVCILKAVEPCMSYEIHRNRETKKLELRTKQRKCLYLYHYYLDPCFGLMNARIQTWFPFSVQVCLNGREWLARRMDKAGLSYERHDNSFPWIEDFRKAQRLFGGLLRLNWPKLLDGFAKCLNPAADAMFAAFPVSYYWSAHQTEWATDVAFDSHSSLASIYPQLTWGAITSFSSTQIMRFLGRRYNGRFSGEVVSSFKDRPEGLRVKHQVNGNSVKMYDKAPTSCASRRPSTSLASSKSTAHRRETPKVRRNGSRCVRVLPTCIDAPKSRRRRTSGISTRWQRWTPQRAWKNSLPRCPDASSGMARPRVHSVCGHLKTSFYWKRSIVRSSSWPASETVISHDSCIRTNPHHHR